MNTEQIRTGGRLFPFTRALICAQALIALFFAAPALAAPGDEEFARGYDAYDARQFTEAVALWRKAANLGHAREQNGLGLLYRDGIGVKKDDKEAVRWLLESASRGYALGMFNLALMYKDGTGVMRNDIEAYKWFYLASTINFDEKAEFERNALSSRMSEAQRRAARERAQEWFDRFFFGRTMNERVKK